MNAIDTNILLYVHDPRDLAKQATAASLVQSLTDGYYSGKWCVSIFQLAASWNHWVTSVHRPGKIFVTCDEFGLRFFLVGVFWIGRNGY